MREERAGRREELRWWSRADVRRSAPRLAPHVGEMEQATRPVSEGARLGPLSRLPFRVGCGVGCRRYCSLLLLTCALLGVALLLALAQCVGETAPLHAQLAVAAHAIGAGATVRASRAPLLRCRALGAPARARPPLALHHPACLRTCGRYCSLSAHGASIATLVGTQAVGYGAATKLLAAFAEAKGRPAARK